MILWFSGTGNSRYVAESLANIIGDTCVSMTAATPAALPEPACRLVMVFPIYSWGVPPFVLDYISNMPPAVVNAVERNRMPVYMVCTCGDETAMAPEMFAEAWSKWGIGVTGIWSVQMPNNYVLLPGFSVDPEAVAEEKLSAAPARIREIASTVAEGAGAISVTRGSHPRLRSRVWPLFKRWGMNPKRWHVSEECVHCGRCAAACPVGNIRMSGGTPSWGPDCLSCTACYHVCPARAIDYGSFTKGKGQYFCRLRPLKK